MLLGGVTFSLGLILVVVADAELFTGNTLIVIALVDKKVALRNQLIVLIGNFIGSVLMVALVYFAVPYEGQHAESAVAITDAKGARISAEVFLRPILCGCLVCLAVWLAILGKIIGGTGGVARTYRLAYGLSVSPTES